MNSKRIAELNRNAWNKIIKEGRNIHASKGKLEESLFKEFTSLLPKYGKVLDLGCGNGIPFGKALFDLGFEVFGVDISDEMIKNYQKNVPDSKTVCKSMTDIEWVNAFDGVISSYSMLCLPLDDFKITALKVARFLKDKGLFLLFLNEGDSKEGAVQEVQGQPMYSTGMSENEVNKIFQPLEMKVLKIIRESETTKEYGLEHSIYFLMEKIS